MFRPWKGEASVYHPSLSRANRCRLSFASLRNDNSADVLASLHSSVIGDGRSTVKHKLAILSFFAFLATYSGFGESYRNPVRIATGIDPDAVLVTDLNGDKRMDIQWTTRGTLIGESSMVLIGPGISEPL